jgi:serine/threonine protein kinase
VTAYGLYAVKVQGERSLGMLLDYKSGGDLKSYIPTDGLPEWMVKGITAPICEALEYLHGVNAVHRDVKPGNVLCDRAADGSLKVVLADFGLAAHIADGKRLSQRCGTGGYIAPEVFQRDWPQKWRTETAADLAKTDMFSFGMLVYATAFGDNPFADKSLDRMYRRNARGLLPLANMAGRSDELQSLLSGLCAKDPRRRLSGSETLLHPWFDSDRGGSSSDGGRKATTVEWAAFKAAAQ